MKYIKVRVSITPPNETASVLLQDELGNRGFESFVDTEDGFEGYIQSTQYSDATMLGVDPPIEGVSIGWKAEEMPDENWNAKWEEEGFTPIEIKDRCTICSEEESKGKTTPYVIKINPEMAFGTGHHETTRLIVKWLLDADMENKRVLDMGCGTGVLGILSSMRGARQVMAVDIDEWSVRNATKNCKINKTRNVSVMPGDGEILRSFGNSFDVVLANINRNIIIDDMEKYVECLRPDGLLVLSGFMTADLCKIKKRAKSLNLTLQKRKADNGWQMMVFEKHE